MGPNDHSGPISTPREKILVLGAFLAQNCHFWCFGPLFWTTFLDHFFAVLIHFFNFNLCYGQIPFQRTSNQVHISKTRWYGEFAQTVFILRSKPFLRLIFCSEWISTPWFYLIRLFKSNYLPPPKILKAQIASMTKFLVDCGQAIIRNFDSFSEIMIFEFPSRSVNMDQNGNPS